MSEAVTFLEKLRPNGPWILDRDRARRRYRTTTVNSVDKIEAFVRKHNGKRNIYYSLNPTKPW